MTISPIIERKRDKPMIHIGVIQVRAFHECVEIYRSRLLEEIKKGSGSSSHSDDVRRSFDPLWFRASQM